jgi:hypothetical protein
MTWGSDLRIGVDFIYTVGGVPATYTDRNAAEKTVDVIVDYNLSQYGDDSVEVSKSTAAISVRTKDVELRPLKGETFVVDGTTFVVSSPLESDELEHTVLVS